jgi:DNA-directed RNA polymerase specialized sigma24 family protein
MEITINYYGQAVSVSMEVYEYLTQADHKAENLAHEQRRHWDGRECDEYIISTEGRLPYYATPEELVCQWETLDEILAVLALCTDTQRERFLLYTLYDFSYAEIGRLCGCSKSAVEKSVSAVKNVFKKFWK